MWNPPSEKDSAENVYRDERTNAQYVFCRYKPMFPSLLALTGWIVVLLEVKSWWAIPWMIVVSLAAGVVRSALVHRHIAREHPDMPVMLAGRRSGLH